MHSMNYEGIWQHILSAAAQHAGTRQPCPNVMPRATFPLSSHHCESLWADLSWNPHLCQPLPKKLESTSKWAWDVFQPEVWLLAPRTHSTRWLADLGLWFSCHGLEQLMEVRPVSLWVPARFVQRWQPLALLHVTDWMRGERIRHHSLTKQQPVTWPQSLESSSAKPRQLNLTTAHTRRQ